VRDLFGRQPARRKFLRTPSGETAQIAQVVTQCALAYPQIRFALTSGDSTKRAMRSLPQAYHR